LRHIFVACAKNRRKITKIATKLRRVSYSDLFRLARYECSHRTCVDATAAVPAHLPGIDGHGVVPDHGIDAAAGVAEARMFVLSAADTDAFAAQYTTVGIVVDAGMAVVYFRRVLNLCQRFGDKAQLEEASDVLEFACAVGMAMLTIDIMNR
jgi:hypothetical protein